LIIKYVFALILGAIFGSFLNMLIYRVSNDVSLTIPRSFCPNCKRTLKWYENIPIFSFLFLKGKCKVCGFKIPKYYFFNEVFLSLLSIFTMFKSSNFFDFTISFLFFTFLHYMAVLDFFYMETDIRPAYFGSLLILIYKFLYFNNSSIFFDVSLIVFLLYYLKEGYFIIRGKEGLGEADIIISAYITSFFGFNNFIYILLLASALNILAFFYFILIKKENLQKLPFVPFLYTSSLLIYIFVNNF